MAERAFTKALGGSCSSPVAAFAVLDDGDLIMRAQIFSEDGSEMVEDRAVFECGDLETPSALARDMLGRAPESIRRLFAGE
jgi:hydroxymethylbilane synthase